MAEGDEIVKEPRWIKRICVPLYELSSKTEQILQTKLEVWWHLIVLLGDNLQNSQSQVLVPFLKFCFGSLEESKKNFSKARLDASLDALLQLLVVECSDASNALTPHVLKDRLTQCVSNDVFLGSCSCFSSSALKAILVLYENEYYDTIHKDRLSQLLWSSLMEHLAMCQEEVKVLSS